MTGPLVSVVIPAYNCEHVLGGTIDCALQQSYRNIEIIVVDDGSTDGTPGVAGRYTGGGKVRYLRQENGGPGAARNRGIDAALGQYFVFIDADDSLSRDSIEKRMALIEEVGNLELVYANYWIRWAEGEATLRFGDAYAEKFIGFRRDYVHGAVVEGDPSAFFGMAFDFWTGAVLVARSLMDLVGPFRTDISVGEDRDMWIRMSMAAERVGYVGSPVACYNRSEKGLTGGDPVRYAMVRRELNRSLLERYGGGGGGRAVGKAIRQSMSWIYYDLGRHYRRIGMRGSAVGNFLRSVYYSPGNRLPYRQIGAMMLPASVRERFRKMFRETARC